MEDLKHVLHDEKLERFSPKNLVLASLVFRYYVYVEHVFSYESVAYFNIVVETSYILKR
jgi:hypothetical protein